MIWKDKNVLITGATHFIGAHLAEELVNRGSNVKAFIRYDYQRDWGSLDKLPLHIKNKIEVIFGSLLNPEAVDFAVESADVVLHLGAFDMIPLNINIRSYFEENTIGTLNMLNAAKKHNLQKFVHISTDEVYGRAERTPIDEKCPLKAQSPHISSDIAAEKLVEGYYLTYNLPVTIARLFNTYGPMQAKDAIVPTIIAQGLVGTQLLLGNMHTIRDFVYVEDVVDALLRMVETPEVIGEAVNLGSGIGISVGDLAERITALIGRDIEILFDATRIRIQGADIEQLVADTTKARRLIEWQSSTSLDVGLTKTIEWFSEHAGI